MESGENEDRGTGTSLVGCLIPVFWMLGGNGILAICAVAIIGRGLVFGPLDVFYWLMVCAVIGARYVDVRYLGGRTSEGTPATMAHWRRHAVILVAVSAVVWIVVHLIPDIGL